MNNSGHGDVAVIGGGFAGCAAAWRLAQAGLKPILIEFKWKLGGRATSYAIHDWPAPVDNGQHVLLGCCVETRKFLDATNAADRVEWFDDLPIADGDGRIETIRPWTLPAPFHLLPFLFRYPGLSGAERMALASGIIRVALSSGRNSAEWADLSRRCGQTENIRRTFWDPILVSVLNFEPDRAAGRYVRRFVRDAFWKSRGGMKIGVPRVPLLTLFSDHIQHALEKSGAALKLGKRVLRLAVNPRGGFIIHLHDQSALNIHHVALATGPGVAKMILEESAELEHVAAKIAPVVGGAPIISVHLLYDRQLTQLPFCMVRNKMIQWIFNKGVHDGRQHLQAVISAAGNDTHQSQMELVFAADSEVRKALGAEGKLVTGNAIIEKDATFPPRPDVVRPGVDASEIPGLFLAGDYVETGWPGTIESAVRSGLTAADAIIRERGRSAAS